MPTIHFTNISSKHKNLAAEFLKSLGLDPEKWLEEQFCELNANTRTMVLGMESTIPEDVRTADKWECRLDEEGDTIRFWLGKLLWGAKFVGRCTTSSLSTLPDNLHALSTPWISDDQIRQVLRFARLSSLHVERCRTVKDIRPLEKLKGLSNLSLMDCSSLKDLRPLQGLECLTNLVLFGCGSLFDIEPLARLRQLSSLYLRGCKLPDHAGPLTELENLLHLHLTGCERLTNLSDLSRLLKLRTLELSWCPSLESIAGLENLAALRSLKLHECAILSDTSPLAGLRKLRSLLLSGCKSLTNLQGLSHLKDLEELRLQGCERPLDFTPLSGITQLRILDVSHCRSLNSLAGLEDLGGLTRLSLSHCSSLADLTALSSLPNLERLDLSGCDSLKDISPLAKIPSLCRLNLSRCSQIVNLSSLTCLPNLSVLSLIGCKSPDLPHVIGGLEGLTTLDLTGCSVGSDLEFVDRLSNLEWLSLSDMEMFGIATLKDISSLRHLRRLAYLDLSGRRHIEDISPLGAIPGLKALKLDGGTLSDLSALGKLTELEDLQMRGFDHVADFSFLSSLRALVKLDLRCRLINDLGPLSNLGNLTNLNLDGCDQIRSLDPLESLQRLESLSFSSRRVRSIEVLRGMHSLKKIDGFDPFETSEVLAFSANARGDQDFIEEYASSWLREAIGAEIGLVLQDRFATTLGEAFSLLGEHAIAEDYEAFLDGRLNFSSAPWKAWFGGTLKESGFDLYRQRVERVDVSQMRPGAIGGACTTLPYEDQPEWSRQWLMSLENARFSDAKNLLFVAPEICLAYARLDLSESLRRWLEAFTDPSDPGLLDPVHAALAGFQLRFNNIYAAESHVFSIESPSLRDPVLVELISSYPASESDRASAQVLLIVSPAIRCELTKTLVKLPEFFMSEVAMHRLVVAMDDCPKALGELITQLPPSTTPSQLITKISESLQLDRKTTLFKIAEELRNVANRLIE